MLVPIDYQIKFVEGEYHLYIIVGGLESVALYSAYHYKSCYEVMMMTKHSHNIPMPKGIN